MVGPEALPQYTINEGKRQWSEIQALDAQLIPIAGEAAIGIKGRSRWLVRSSDHSPKACTAGIIAQPDQVPRLDDALVAPPGYYMLFVVDQNRVPSVARIVKLQ